MSKHLMYVVAHVLSIALTASATQYQPREGTRGYVERQIAANPYNIAFSGNGSTASDRIAKAFLYRYTELATEAFYSYFVMNLM